MKWNQKLDVQLTITHIEISFVSLLQTILAQILQETVLSRKYYVSPFSPEIL